MTSAVVLLLATLAQAPTSAADGVITGRVLHAETRVPLADATVTLQPDANAMWRTPRTAHPLWATTDAEGRFALMGVPGRSYTVLARKGGYADAHGGRGRRFVTVPAGGVSDLELLLAPGGVILGRVVDARGLPLAQAMVTVLRASDPGSATTQEQRDGRAVTERMLGRVSAGELTDAEGAFKVDQIPVGEYYVRVTPPATTALSGGADGSPRAFVRTYYPGSSRPADAMLVRAVAGVPVQLGDLAMQAADAFQVSGRVVDESGRGVPDVRVRLVPGRAPATALPLTRQWTDTHADGSFGLVGILAGDYTLVAVPAVMLPRAGDAAPDPSVESMSFTAGGGPDTTHGSVWTESRRGVARQYRDEFGTRLHVIVDADLPNLHIVVRSAPLP